MIDEETENKALEAMSAFATAFSDTIGRLQRSNPEALEAMMSGRNSAIPFHRPNRRPRKALADFKRDLAGANVLIARRWGVRGTTVMIVSSTGTGKSVVQTQMALSFALGIPCCGLVPTRPFRSWVIQSEDDEDRVAIDRDDIVAEMSELRPDLNFTDALREVTFIDFTSYTGAKFLDELEKELALTPEEDKPDCIFINPMNAYFGGSLKEGVDCSAFFKGGSLQGKDTDGLEAIAKRYGILVIIFGHTPKPPTPKELQDWIDDPNIAYKMCGASEIADAVRSILVFLRVPDTDNMFVFNAGKNGFSLGWTDANGVATTKSYWQWAASGKHFWEEVPKEEWPGTDTAKASAAKAALDADISVVLSHMGPPGISIADINAHHKEWGIPLRRARNAYYAIVKDRMKYGVASNIVPIDRGMHKTLYQIVSASSPQTPTPAQAQQADEPPDIDDPLL